MLYVCKKVHTRGILVRNIMLQYKLICFCQCDSALFMHLPTTNLKKMSAMVEEKRDRTYCQLLEAYDNVSFDIICHPIGFVTKKNQYRIKKDRENIAIGHTCSPSYQNRKYN